MRRLKALLSGLAMIAAANGTADGGTQQRVVVPAFFPIAGSNDWSRIQAAGTSVQIAVAGGGYFINDSGSTLSNDQAQFNQNRAAGQLILGYVPTADGQRLAQDVDSDVRQWYLQFPTQIDGIFFDQGPLFTGAGGPSDAFLQSYYGDLHTRFKTAQPSAKEMLNAAGFPNQWIMAVADYVTIWEAPYVDPNGHASYRDRFVAIGTDGIGQTPPTWWYTYGSRITHLVLGITNQTDMNDAICKSRYRGSPSLYVYDGPTAHYDHLSSMFEQEIAGLQPTLHWTAIGSENCYVEFGTSCYSHQWIPACPSRPVQGKSCYSCADDACWSVVSSSIVEEYSCQ